MKTSGIILIFCLLTIFSVSGQTSVAEKSDSLQNELLKPHYKSFENSLKFNNQFPDKHLQIPLPERYTFNRAPEMALKRIPGDRILISPLDRMPIYCPEFQSGMPVMKPDTTIKYHLLIKRINRVN